MCIRDSDWGVPLRRIVGVRYGGGCGGISRNPLPRTGRALHQIPVIAEQRLEEAVVPGHRGRCPSALQPAGDRIAGLPAAKGVLPAEALLLEAGTFGFATNVLVRIGGTMGLAERVTAGDEGNRLLVVHGHASKRLSNVPGGGERTRFTVRALGIHIDEAHLHRTERICELAVAAVALVSEPGVLRPPINILFGLPHVHAPTTETEGLETHRLESTVTSEDNKVGPGDLPAVLLLNRPEQTARLVQVGVVGPAVAR